MRIPKVDGLLAIKLASLVVHADEYTSPHAHPFDGDAIRALLADADVQAWLAGFDPALLPVKREAR